MAQRDTEGRSPCTTTGHIIFPLTALSPDANALHDTHHPDPASFTQVLRFLLPPPRVAEWQQAATAVGSTTSDPREALGRLAELLREGVAHGLERYYAPRCGSHEADEEEEHPAASTAALCALFGVTAAAERVAPRQTRLVASSDTPEAAAEEWVLAVRFQPPPQPADGVCFPQHVQLGAGWRLPVYRESRRSPPRPEERGASSLQHAAAEGEEASWRAAPLLVVGAGGIGCELIKVLVLSGYRHLHIIDLDTVDGTNLNRQFLFELSDVGQPKSFTTRRAILRWWGIHETSEAEQGQGSPGAVSCPHAHHHLGPPPRIVAYHDDITSPQFDETFYKQFAAVLNALDNVAARQWVNRMCCRTGRPLIESGTMGYNGQVQPIVPGTTECYDCHPKPTNQVSFAVCTIHARPTKYIHCVHFAKELYEVLFGARQQELQHDPNGTDGEAEAASPQQHVSELGYLKDWRVAWETALRQCASGPGRWAIHQQAARDLAQIVFHDKLEQLLAMKSTWVMAPPTPLGRLFPRAVEKLVSASEGTAGDSNANPAVHVRIGREKEQDSTAPAPEQTIRQLLDPYVSPPPIPALYDAFCFTAAQCLASRCTTASTAAPHGGGVGVGFHKEDDLAVWFVAATAGLRAYTYQVGPESPEATRTIAGRIVPSVVTANAMAGAGVVQQLDRLLQLRHAEAMAPALHSPERVEDVLRVLYIRKVPLILRRPAALQPLFGPQKTSPSARLDLCGGGDTLTARTGRKRRRQERSAEHREGCVVHPVPLSCPPQRLCRTCGPLGCPPRLIVVRGISFPHCTLRALVEGLLTTPSAGAMEEPTVSLGPRILYEGGSYEDLAEKVLAEFATPRCTPALQGAAAVAVAGSQGDWLPMTLAVDALNRDVAWEVVLLHDPHAAVRAEAVVVEGLAAALRHEERVMACRMAQQREEEEKKKEERGVPTADTATGTIVVVDDEVNTNQQSNRDGEEDVEEVLC